MEIFINMYNYSKFNIIAKKVIFSFQGPKNIFLKLKLQPVNEFLTKVPY